MMTAMMGVVAVRVMEAQPIRCLNRWRALKHAKRCGGRVCGSFMSFVQNHCDSRISSLILNYQYCTSLKHRYDMRYDRIRTRSMLVPLRCAALRLYCAH